MLNASWILLADIVSTIIKIAVRQERLSCVPLSSYAGKSNPSAIEPGGETFKRWLSQGAVGVGPRATG